MNFIEYPGDLLDSWLPHIDQNHLVPQHYRQLGVVILRNAVPRSLITQVIDAWNNFYSTALADGRQLDPYNQVVMHETVPEILGEIYRHPVLLDIMQQIYPDLGFYLQRFVIKDIHNRQAVILHQDYCYNLGWPDKTSLFLPLGPMNPGNGGLVLYPGTHHLGYLGDAGELNPDILDPAWPTVAPALKPGDLVLMHDCTWHASPPRTSEIERILVQITYQPADDPSNTIFLRGNANPAFTLGKIDRNRVFKRSRSSRLRELQEQVNKLSK